ncbi:hypothetical protein K458DRAFT_426153 [Lentithecium fluviatile CBS 122367]|uniref:DUF7730 domain-containing protein n=1 Tax=Lentithecium fluviatile CBS 122367 TaxID=1168545 RepID=A0A6G1JKE7_9PLEO|nr:hypothetical protein K458DRAFT_426153 [Lentithecium fluviatile CBS 122367]
MNESQMKTPRKLLPCSGLDLDDILNVTGLPFDETDEPYGHRLYLRKAKLKALSKTCHAIYLETIDTLYSANVFVFLQNPTLTAFRAAVSKQNFEKIRSLHIHWSLRVQRKPGPPLPYWHTEACRKTSAAVVSSMHHLQELSIFLQGPLHDFTPFEQLLSGVLSGKSSPHFFIVRPPLPYRATRPSDSSEVRIRALESSGGKDDTFKVCRPALEFGRKWKKFYDNDGHDCYEGWRVGALFLSDHRANDGFLVTNYIVCTPPPQNEEFYCRRWGFGRKRVRGRGED